MKVRVSLMMLLVAASAAVPTTAEAALGDCTSFTPVFPRKVWDYKISLDTCDDLIGVGIDCDELITTVIAASQVWNETTNGPLFRFTGTTSNADSSCSNSTVTIGSAHSSGEPARTTFKCPHPAVPALSSQFVIRVFQSSDGNTIPWEAGIASSAELDLMSALVHEFGHVLGMNHPTAVNAADDAGASMRPTFGLQSGFDNWTFGDTQGRSPYHYDLKCAAQAQGNRELLSFAFSTDSEGGLGNFTPVSDGIQNVASAAVGLCQASNNTPRFCSSLQTSDKSFHKPNLQFTNLLGPLSEPDDFEFGYTPFIFQEIGQASATFTSFVNDNDFPTDFGVDSSHNLYKSNESNTFATSTTWEHCNVISSNCPSETRVRSGHPLAVAFSQAADETVAVWADQTRDDSPADREIKISIGLSRFDSTGLATLQMPFSTGIRTSSAPAIACRVSPANQCILAYTSPTSTRHVITTRVVTIQFDAALGVFKPVLGPPVTSLDMDTNSRIALWCSNGGKCFLAAKLLRANEPIGLWSTTTGSAWTMVDSTYTTSPIGPTAPSAWDRSPSRILLHSVAN
jgi:hypothetical protein